MYRGHNSQAGWSLLDMRGGGGWPGLAIIRQGGGGLGRSATGWLGRHLAVGRMNMYSTNCERAGRR